MQKSSLLNSNAQASRNTFLILGIIFVAFTLRAPITSVGPLVSTIRDDIGMTNSEAGFITTLPLLAFALLSPLAPRLSLKIGKEMTVLLALIVLGIGIIIRSTGMVSTLFLGTGIMGLGIAFSNVILPGIVKQSFPTRVGLMTGVYTVSMGTFAGIAPGISAPLAENFHMGWQGSLSVWILIVLVGVIVWSPQIKKNQASTGSTLSVNHPSSSMLKSPLAWQVTLFMGLQSLIYFSFITWLPEMLYTQGISITAAGWMVAIFQFSGIPTGFLIPIIADRLPNQKPLAVCIGILCMTGLIGVLIGGPIILLTLFIICIGLGTGAALSLALTFIGMRAANAEQAANLSGMAQSFGYFIAAFGPIALGFIFDLLHTWTLPLILLIVVSIIMTFCGYGAGRDEYIFQMNMSDNQLHY
jgi:MFS transporter, CP family, cyanate transporter